MLKESTFFILSLCD